MPENLYLLTDEQLAIRAKKQPELFDILYQRYFTELLRFIIFRFGQDRAQSEDLAQETLLKAYLNLNLFNPQKKWKTWLFQIAVNSARSFFRKPAFAHLEENLQIPDLKDSPEAFAEKKIMAFELERVLARLNNDLRIVLAMHYKDGKSIVQIGTELDLSFGAIKARLERAKHQLKFFFKLEMND